MYFKIFENGVEINRIVSSLEFVKFYCEGNGFTYEEYNNKQNDESGEIE